MQATREQAPCRLQQPGQLGSSRGDAALLDLEACLPNEYRARLFPTTRPSILEKLRRGFSGAPTFCGAGA
jgi:hypothetical protein